MENSLLAKLNQLAFGVGLYLLLIPACHASSVAFWNNNDHAKVVARSMDLHEPDFPQMRASPAGITRIGDISNNHMIWKSRYGSVAITAFKTNAASEGINDQGLSVHALYLEKTNYGERNHEVPALSNALWVQYMLDNFKTVNEALSSLSQYQIISTKINEKEWPLHLTIQDASGDSAIIEFINGKPIIHHGREVTVMTNESLYDQHLEQLKQYKSFGGQANLPGDADPMSRFVRASSYLKTLPAPTNHVEAHAGIDSVIRTTMVPYGTRAWPTRWTTIADLTNKTYYFSTTNSSTVIWVDLKKLNLKNDSKVKMLDPTGMKTSGDISKHFK